MKQPIKIAPLTSAERQELAEILGTFGLFRRRPNLTNYRRTTKGGNSTPKGTNAMSPEMNASMQRSMQAAEERFHANRTAKAASMSNITLNHYSGEPVVIAPSEYGLTPQEAEAVRKPVAAKAVEEYARSSQQLRHSGTDLATYMRGAYWDEAQGDVPEELHSACTKLQRRFGAVIDLANGGLTYV